MESWVAEYEQVVVRKQPLAQAHSLTVLQRGDVFSVEGKVDRSGPVWLKLPKGSQIVQVAAGGGRKVLQELEEDGFVLSEHPTYGVLVKRNVKVLTEKEEGMLSKEEMEEVLRRSSNAKDLVVPLEAKTWSKGEFELFVMSGGVVRPKGCSVPDTFDLLNTQMSPDQVEAAIWRAAEWIASADAILVGSGAGMGVDSGLSTFRGGKAGVWPALDAVGLAYEEICDPKWFPKEPALAWAFWNFCHEAYRSTQPHSGYELVRTWAEQVPLGAFSFTSNIDSHWAASGWSKRRIIEVHGVVTWLQCSKPCCGDVWEAPPSLGLTEDPSTHRAVGQLPQCPKCNAVARPNVQMFGGDNGFAKSRRAMQINRYDGWLKRMESRPDSKELRVVCLELGCGLTVPTVRRELESVMRRFPGARLIRVNPEQPGVAKEFGGTAVSLPLAASTALSQIQPQVAQLKAAQNALPQALFVLWDTRGGGVEFHAPGNTPMGRLLRLAETAAGAEIEFEANTALFATNLMQLHVSEEVPLGSCVPLGYFWSLDTHFGRALTEDDPPALTPTAVVKCQGLFFKGGMSEKLAGRVGKITAMLDSMNVKFGDPAYQDGVRQKRDRKQVMQMVRDVHLQVLPKFGLPADETGVMRMQAHTGLGMVGRLDVGEKAGLSMQLSYVMEAAKLPAGPPKEGKPYPTPAPPSMPRPLEVTVSVPAVKAPVPAENEKTDATPPSTSLEVAVMLMGGDDLAPVRISAVSNTTVAHFRELFGQRLRLEERTLQQVKFLFKFGSGFGMLKDDELIRRELLVHGVERSQWTRKEVPAKASQEKPKRRGYRPKEKPPLTLEDALALQTDLIAGFSEDSFQRKLKELHMTLRRTNERKFNMERNKLFLVVQKEVLPHYGFEGSTRGVFDMMGILGTGGFDWNEDFSSKGALLQRLLFPEYPDDGPQATPPAAEQRSAANSTVPPRPSRSAPGTEQPEGDWREGIGPWMDLTFPDNESLKAWLLFTAHTMPPEVAAAWQELPKDKRLEMLSKVISSPLFTRCRVDWQFAQGLFCLDGLRAPWSTAAEDPDLSLLLNFNPVLLARWFTFPSEAQPAAASNAAAYPQVCSSRSCTTRAGEDH